MKLDFSKMPAQVDSAGLQLPGLDEIAGLSTFEVSADDDSSPVNLLILGGHTVDGGAYSISTTSPELINYYTSRVRTYANTGGPIPLAQQLLMNSDLQASVMVDELRAEAHREAEPDVDQDVTPEQSESTVDGGYEDDRSDESLDTPVDMDLEHKDEHIEKDEHIDEHKEEDGEVEDKDIHVLEDDHIDEDEKKKKEEMLDS
uniref:Uncharacterized protein n=1 Tax=viral metagenome TaxID=1070528 RepID=A0A2V0RBW2_9ZZZZ